MSILQIILAAILLLGPLVAIHEFGHFWVARRLGVKVLVYSIGFGPVLWKRQSKDGVQYQLAAIPLGGYVRMADEREGEVAAEDLPRAFNRQSPWARIAIVAAGPLINLMFAVLLFWLLFLPPSEQLNTRVHQVIPNSVAAQAGLMAGDRIIQVDGQPTTTLEELNYALLDRMGESGTVHVTAERHQQVHTYPLPLTQFLSGTQQDPMSALGFRPWQPTLAPIIGQVVAGGAAERYQLQVGDRIVAINQQPITDWLQFSEIIKKYPEKLVALKIERQGKVLDLSVMPQAKRDAMGHEYGQLGLAAQIPKSGIQAPADYRQIIQHNPWQALVKAGEKTWDLSVMTVQAFGKMIRGLIGLDNISGPITIAKVAGHTAELGWQSFIGFMALMSVSLGILNLLPIPVLDGGHLVYYFVEAVRGRPLSEQIQAFGFRIGMAMLGALMLLALFNDFSRLG